VFHRSARLTLAVAALGAVTVSGAALPGAAQAAGGEPPKALLGNGPKPIPLKNAAMILRTEWGYRYIAGQQHSDLTVRLVDGNLVYSDRGTRELRDIPGTCNRRSVDVGIQAVCSVPAQYDSPNSMFLEIWPRLGDDAIDGSSLPSTFRMWVLGDRGRDVVRTGAGNDFVNGAQDADKVWGGGGDDWIRTGIGDDTLVGEGGDDKLVGVDGNDTVDGGEGDDRVGGGPGSDRLTAGGGQDLVACGGGPDNAWVDSADRTTECESVSRS
jgi:serralysin